MVRVVSSEVRLSRVRDSNSECIGAVDMAVEVSVDRSDLGQVLRAAAVVVVLDQRPVFVRLVVESIRDRVI